jgi:hypothetical protein
MAETVANVRERLWVEERANPRPGGGKKAARWKDRIPRLVRRGPIHLKKS